MRTNVVLIDFENVKPVSLGMLDRNNCKVLLFVGASQSKVPFELASAMQAMGDRARYVKIAGNGSNALDFHIAFYIGELAAQDPDAFFHIISEDAGFDPLIAHLKSRKILCCRSPTIVDMPLSRAIAHKSATERAQSLISMLRQPKATRPVTAKTLSSTISSFFAKQLSEEEIAAVGAAMQELGFLKLVDGKVTYLIGD